MSRNSGMGSRVPMGMIRRAAVSMARALGVAALALGACSAPDKEPEIAVPYEDQVRKTLEQQGDEEGQLIRRTHQNVQRWEALRVEMQTQPMAALHRTIAQSVDGEFDVFRRFALDSRYQTLQNWSIACLGFAIEKKKESRELIESLLRTPDQQPWLRATECFALRVLRDPATDLSLLIPLVGHANPGVRASAAYAIAEIWAVSETPRDLTPQHYAAIDRLAGLLHDRATTQGRRAAAIALARLRHPDVLDHLLAALEDQDLEVQVAALAGIEWLGDARALEALFEFLDSDPAETPATFAVRALQQIAVQNGFAQTKGETESLGTSGKAWRKWFRAQRSK